MKSETKLEKTGRPLQSQLTLVTTVQDSGDLETAATAISAVAEAAGVGSADYSAALTIPAPSDNRLTVLRIASRISVTIDSFNAGAAHLYVRVYVDAQDANHRLFDLDLTAPAANKLAAQDTLVGTKEVIFNLLKEGAAHTFYVFMWVDAGNVVVSVCNLWAGIGSCGGGIDTPVLKITHSGFISVAGYNEKIGTGNPRWELTPVDAVNYMDFFELLTAGPVKIESALIDNAQIRMGSTVATDIGENYGTLYIVLRGDN